LEEKGQIGYFIDYDSNDAVLWEVYLPTSNSFLTTVRLLFDERIHDGSDDYFCKLDKAASVFTGPEANKLSDLEHLIGYRHVIAYASLLYVTKRELLRKVIVGGIQETNYN
jgi:hypothetical protein